jgi:CRP/FNR family transcriptional regulator, cyclic AMP receptor protein
MSLPCPSSSWRTTRSRVSFVMNKFRKLGFIDYNGRLQVRSSLLNVVLHD